MILLILGLLSAFFGFADAEVVSNEHSAAKSLQGRFGPDALVKVRMKLSGLASLHGDLAGVNVTVQHFALDGIPWSVDPSKPKDGRVKRMDIHLVHGTARGFVVDRIDLSVPEIRYDFRAAKHHQGFVLSRAGDGTFQIQLSEATLAEGAARKQKSLSQVKVVLDSGHLNLTAMSKSGLGSLPISLDGRLAERDGHLLVLEDAVVNLNGKPLGPDSAKAILGSMNPLLDFDKDFGQPGMFRLSSVSILDHRLLLAGTLRLPEKVVGN